MKTLIFAAMRCSLMFTAVAALSVAYPAKANLITNPGFETGDFTGWTTNWSVGGTRNGIAPHSGNFQAFAFQPLASLEQTLATTPGQSYTIDFWVATSNVLSLTVNFGGTVFSHFFAGATGYTEFTFNATASSASTSISFTRGFEPFPVFLDDISVEPAGVGVPDGGSTVSLLGCALLGLAALRRKLGW